MFSIPEDQVNARREVLDLLLDQVAFLMHVSAVNQEIGIDFLQALQTMNQPFIPRGVPEVPEPEA